MVHQIRTSTAIQHLVRGSRVRTDHRRCAVVCFSAGETGRGTAGVADHVCGVGACDCDYRGGDGIVVAGYADAGVVFGGEGEGRVVEACGGEPDRDSK